MTLDAVVLGAFTVMKLRSDPTIVAYAFAGIVAILVFERVYLSRWVGPDET